MRVAQIIKAVIAAVFLLPCCRAYAVCHVVSISSSNMAGLKLYAGSTYSPEVTVTVSDDCELPLNIYGSLDFYHQRNAIRGFIPDKKIGATRTSTKKLTFKVPNNDDSFWGDYFNTGGPSINIAIHDACNTKLGDFVAGFSGNLENAYSINGALTTETPVWSSDPTHYPPPIFPMTVVVKEPVFAPDYLTTTEQERKFTPKLPASPFDTILIPVQFACSRADRTQMNLTLETTDASGNRVLIINEPATSLVADPHEAGTYNWRLTGWPSGITPDAAKMDALIDSIHWERPVQVVPRWNSRISDANPEGFPISEPTNIDLTNCAHIYGSGEFKIVQINTTGTYSGQNSLFSPTSAFVRTAEACQKSGFGRFDSSKNSYSGFAPFNRAEDKFSHYADLYRQDDSARALGPQKYFESFDVTTSCEGEIKEKILYSSRIPRSYTRLGASSIFIESSHPGAKTVMHEMGHAFAELSDEYDATEVNPLAHTPLNRNCVKNPNPFSHTGGYWGTNNVLYGEVDKKGCTLPKLYRPSDGSMMERPVFGFNVICCGYIKEVIESISPSPKKAADYFPECSQMDGIIKPGE